MKKFSALNPIGIFSVAAIAFVGWVVYDLNRPAEPRPRAGAAADPFEPEIGVAAIKGLEHLRPGMPRPEVESYLRHTIGTSAGEVDPVDLTAGFPTYRVRYGFTGNALHQPTPRMMVAKAQIITITYDARTVGHPLVSISVAPSSRTTATAA